MDEEQIYKKMLNDMLDNHELCEKDFLTASKLKSRDFLAYDEATQITAEKWSFIRSQLNRHIENMPLAEQERQPCEVWSRVMGYFRPLSEFNKGKKAEFRERRPFSENKVTKERK